MAPGYSERNWDVIEMLFDHPVGSNYTGNLEGIRESCKDADSTPKRLASLSSQKS